MDKTQVRSVAQEPRSSTLLQVNGRLMYGSRIHFNQSFPMFKNNGKDVFNFDAKYNATLIGYFERGGRIEGQRAEFPVETLEYVGYRDPICAVSVFSTKQATGSLEFRLTMENDAVGVTTIPGMPIVLDLFT
ncbi:hypothetical protein EYR40_002712 [Pleurotus pulmonarius]|nr:hypothetical protein EYR40_002712 [Pleurotus pulmonarius]KAF4582435.1 hypothetical protein EYR38_002555 [Pleurotus pulmonarius]